MPAQVRVDVKVEDQKALQQLSNLEKQVAKLNKQGIKIKVETGQNGQNGLKTVAADAQKASRAVELSTDSIVRSVKKVNGEVKQTTQVFQESVDRQRKVITDFGEEEDKVTEIVTVDERKKQKQIQQTTRDVEKAIEAQRKALYQLENDMEKEAAAREKQAEKIRLAAEKEAKAEEDAANRRIASWARVAKVAATAVLTKATRDALSTMKEVDSELANIRKVTDESAESIAKLGEQAYDTASKYGVSAKEYLSAAASFAKAGYSNYGNLAELAIKTQLVGDVTADMASQFLLSADAAYKFQGNVESLTTVLDRANWVENNYATSIEKIAEGLPIVASTASMANMSMDELVASLGTITAVTQETGRKAATALRALILNITGEVGALLEDEQGEFEVTAESVKSMSDALEKYGSEAIKAAKASGDLIDPIEAIRSLSTAYQNGDLSRNELFSILTEIGGKLRTNQLAALVENFGMFEEMLQGVEKSAGSADKEVNVMLETWNAKTEQLRNTWTKFISDVIESDSVKKGIDFLTKAIRGLDEFIQTPTGKNTAKAVGITVGLEAALDVIKTLKKSSIGNFLSKEFKTAKDAIDGQGGLVGALDTLKTKLKNLSLDQWQSIGQWTTLIGELMMLIGIVDARVQTNKDRFANIYGQSTAEVTGFGNLVSQAVKANSGSGDAAMASALSTIVEQYRDTYNRLKQDVTKENSALFEAEMGFKAEDFIRNFELAEKSLKHYEEAAEGAATATDELDNSFDDTARSVDSATEALERFAKATEQSKSANADTYRSDYQQFLEDWKSGKTDTNAVRAAIDLFIPEEVQAQMGYDMQALGELLAGKMYQGIFNGSLEDSAADFANYLYDTMGKELEGVAKVTQEADGTLSFEYASAEKLAAKLKLPLAVVKSLIEALDEYGVEVEMGWEETENLAQKIGLIGENAQESSKNIESVVRSLSGMEEYANRIDMRKAFNALADAGYIDISGLSAEEINKQIQAALDKIDAEKEIELKTDEAEEKAGEFEEALGKIPDKKTARILANVYGTKDVWGLVDAINSANSKSITVGATVSTGTVTSKPVTVVNHSRASGTRNDPGGPTLVNELGPELISDNGRAYIANGGKPAIVSLGKGAIVLTAEETRQAIGGIHAAASGIPRASGTSGLSTSYNAHVESSGQDMSEEEIVREQAKALETLAEYYHNMKQHSEEAASYQEAINKLERIRAWYRANGLTETDTRMASVANEIFALQEKVAEANTHAIDDLEEELENLDDQIRLAEYQGDTQKALLLEQQAQKKIAELIKAYQDAGYSDTSDEILRLVNNGYSYSESSDSRLSDMRKDLIAAIKAMKETQDEANDLAEKQLAVTEARTALENAQNQRTVRIFNPVTGQWEWVANAGDVLDAQEALKSAEDALAKEQQSRELDALEKALGNGTSLSDISIGPALSALISGANVEETNALATALGVLTGGIKTTADTSAKSVFDSIDSHDSVTNYTFNGVNVGKDVAETTTLAQLARMISPLALTGNMPA